MNTVQTHTQQKKILDLSSDYFFNHANHPIIFFGSCVDFFSICRQLSSAHCLFSVRKTLKLGNMSAINADLSLESLSF